MPQRSRKLQGVPRQKDEQESAPFLLSAPPAFSLGRVGFPKAAEHCSEGLYELGVLAVVSHGYTNKAEPISILEGFDEKYKATGAVVAAVDLVKGIGALAGFSTPRVEGATGYLDTDYGAKARCALELLAQHDIVYVHVEAPDEASHEGNLHEKINAIESIDEKVVGYLMEHMGQDVRLLVVTDHATPLSLRTHFACPVPFTIFEKGRRLGSGGTFDEKNGGKLFTGEQMIALFLRGLES